MMCERFAQEGLLGFERLGRPDAHTLACTPCTQALGEHHALAHALFLSAADILPRAGWQTRVRWSVATRPRIRRLRAAWTLCGILAAFFLGFLVGQHRTPRIPGATTPVPQEVPPALLSYVEEAICRTEAQRDLSESVTERERYQSEAETLRKLRHSLDPSRPYIEQPPETTDPLEGIPKPRSEP